MSKTIDIPNPARIVRYFYEDGRDRFVEIVYANTKFSVQIDYTSRQEQYKIAVLEVTGYLRGESAGDLQFKIAEAHRILQSSRGRLEVIEGGVAILIFSPASGHFVAPIGSVGGRRRTHQLYWDIEHGPKPTHLVIDEFIGRTARIEWGVSVRAHSEDAVKGVSSGTIPSIVSVESTVTYGLDQAGITTRRVAGVITGRNVGAVKYFLRGFHLDPQTRVNLVRSGFGPVMDAISLPPYFIRLVQDYVIDASENMMQFSIVDHEIYRRGLPPHVLVGDVSVTTLVEGIGALGVLIRNISGEFQGHMDGHTGDLLIQVFRIIQAIIDDRSGSVDQFVPRTTFIVPNLYTRNAIAFDVQISAPVVGAFEDIFRTSQVDPTPGLPMSQSFPTDPLGSAALTGSGYRLARGGKRAEIFTEEGFISEELTDAIKASRHNTKRSLGEPLYKSLKNASGGNVDLFIRQPGRTFTVTPNVEKSGLDPEDVSDVESASFNIGPDTIVIEVRGVLITNFRDTGSSTTLGAGGRGESGVPTDFITKLGFRDAKALGVVRAKRMRVTTMSGAWGSVRQAMVRGGYFLILSGKTIARIRETFGDDMEAFVVWLKHIDTLTNKSDSIIGRLRKKLDTN